MRGLDVDMFSSVVSEIYDCSLQPEGWTGALTRVAALMDAAYATVALNDLPGGRAVMVAHSPWDPQMLQQLNDDYGIEGVPGLRDVMMGELDAPNSTMNQMEEAEFQQTRFYQHWVKPQGLREASVCKFVQTGERLGIWAAVTRAGRDVVSADERRFMQIISPHLRRAAMIGDLLDMTRVTAKLYQNTLAALSSPVFLTDGAGNVVFANPAAETVLAGGQGVKLARGKLSGVTQTGADGLADAIARAGASELSLGGRGIGIPLSAPGHAPMVAYVLPLTQGTRRGNFARAAVAVFLSAGGGALLPPDTTLVTLFDLTQAEARVALRIAAGDSIGKAAGGLSLSENTVKTHLKRVFAKTGTSRQAELARLVSATLAPVL